MARRAPDDAALLELVGEVMGLLELSELTRALLGALLRAVPSEWASLNEIGPDGVTSLVEPHLDAIWFDKFGELAHENPIYQRWVRTQDGRAYRFSDVTTREELEATRIFREFYGPLGVNHQIAFTLPSDAGRVLALVLSRADPDFSDAERDFLNRARPFLIQAYTNALAYGRRDRPAPAGIETALVAQGLTAREAEVVRLVTLGGTNDEIGSALGVSPRTVQKHLQNSYAKLGVRSRAGAAARALDAAASSADWDHAL